MFNAKSAQFRRVGIVAAALGALALCGQTPGCQTFNSNLTATTANLVALNNAIVQIDTTIINNTIAEAKLLAPYNCGAYALASTIIESSPAASKVNAYFELNLAAGVTNVAVSKVCGALGYPTTVTAAAPAASN